MLGLVQYVVRGGIPLHGEISISGAKNAAVAIIPAALTVCGVCRIENIPKISDVTLMLEIMQEMGARVRLVTDSAVEIDCSSIRNCTPSYEMVRSFRASYYLVGALLARFGSAQVNMPGGCDFGVRPIDQHIKGFEALGAHVEVKNGLIHASVPAGRVAGAPVYLDVASVGATINIMLAAVLAEGLTVIENAAREPHVVDVANFLNCMGADVKGAGTNIIKVRGRKSIAGGTYSIIPDQIEAGTYMTAAAAAGGNVLITGVIPKHLDCISAKLIEMGVQIDEYDEAIRVRRSGPLRKTNIKTLFYPGFPTDMQPQAAAVLCLAKGTSMITEGVYDDRYRYVDELKRLGAKISVDGRLAVIEGVGALTGAPVQACDLRAGAGLVVAALSAQGTTTIDGIHHIERGYENLVEKLQGVGADILRRDCPEYDILAPAL